MNTILEFRWSLVRAAGLASIIALSGCATVESGADHVRTFAQDHPVVTGVAVAAASVAIGAAIEHHHDQHEFARRLNSYGLHTHCVPAPHGDVLLPPSGGEQVCP